MSTKNFTTSTNTNTSTNTSTTGAQSKKVAPVQSDGHPFDVTERTDFDQVTYAFQCHECEQGSAKLDILALLEIGNPLCPECDSEMDYIYGGHNQTLIFVDDDGEAAFVSAGEIPEIGTPQDENGDDLLLEAFVNAPIEALAVAE